MNGASPEATAWGRQSTRWWLQRYDQAPLSFMCAAAEMHEKRERTSNHDHYLDPFVQHQENIIVFYLLNFVPMVPSIAIYEGSLNSLSMP